MWNLEVQRSTTSSGNLTPGLTRAAPARPASHARERREETAPSQESPTTSTASDCQGDRDLRVKVAAYPGETGRNMFERGKEHLTNLEKRSEVDSVLWLHSLYHHQGREDVEYRMVCTGGHRSPLDRQLSEKIQISRFQGDILMNRKSEMGGAVAERERWKYRRWGAGGTR